MITPATKFGHNMGCAAFLASQLFALHACSLKSVFRNCRSDTFVAAGLQSLASAN
jgi:hypothetical protein